MPTPSLASSCLQFRFTRAIMASLCGELPGRSSRVTTETTAAREERKPSCSRAVRSACLARSSARNPLAWRHLPEGVGERAVRRLGDGTLKHGNERPGRVRSGAVGEDVADPVIEELRRLEKFVDDGFDLAQAARVQLGEEDFGRPVVGPEHVHVQVVFGDLLLAGHGRGADRLRQGRHVAPPHPLAVFVLGQRPQRRFQFLQRADHAGVLPEFAEGLGESALKLLALLGRAAHLEDVLEDALGGLRPLAGQVRLGLGKRAFLFQCGRRHHAQRSLPEPLGEKGVDAVG